MSETMQCLSGFSFQTHISHTSFELIFTNCPLLSLTFSHPFLFSGLQVKMPSPRPYPLHRLPSSVTRKPAVEVTPIPAPGHPAPVGTVAQRVEGRDAVAHHDRRTIPDTLSGQHPL